VRLFAGRRRQRDVLTRRHAEELRQSRVGGNHAAASVVGDGDPCELWGRQIEAVG